MTEGADEGRLKRWSRRKGLERAGKTPAPESPGEPQREAAEKPQVSNKGGKKQRGAAAPVAERRFVPVMPPLAEPEEGEIEMEAAPPEALALKAQLEAEQAEREEEEAEEDRELTPEQAEAVAKLPPLESLHKDSDFTPFFAGNIPDFIKRQAYRVLWRSNPFFNLRDGLDDYDEDFSLSKLVGNIVSEAKGKGKSKAKAKAKAKAKTKAKAKAEAEAKGKTKPGQARAGDETAKAAAPEKGASEDGGEDDDLGDADGEDGG